MRESPHIVSFSHDPLLGMTRASVLATRFDTVAVSSLEELEAVSRSDDVAIVVLCHTVSEQERQRAIELARSSRPPKRVVVLTSVATAPPMEDDGIACVGARPEQLLGAVWSALTQSQA